MESLLKNLFLAIKNWQVKSIILKNAMNLIEFAKHFK